MSGELSACFGGSECDLSVTGTLRSLLVWVREAVLLCLLLLPCCEIRCGYSLHAIDLDVERVATGKSVFNPVRKGNQWDVLPPRKVDRRRKGREYVLVSSDLVHLVQMNAQSSRRVEPPRAHRASEVFGLLMTQEDTLVFEGAVTVLQARRD